jgi:acyl carrier protein
VARPLPHAGKGSYERATGKATFDGLDITMEGFDVATGNTTWSVPLGPAQSFVQQGRNVTAVNDVEVLVQTATGPLLVDLSDGSTRRPTATEAFWCSEGGFFEYRESRRLTSGETRNTWRRGDLLFTCAPDGSPSPSTPAFLPESLGATVDGRTVIAQGNGLVAYDRRWRATTAPGGGVVGVAETVVAIIADGLGVDPSRVTGSASFTDDLGADSLALTELTMAIEQEFGLDIPDEDAEQIDNAEEAIA